MRITYSNRQPAGSPHGGQFGARSRAEAEVQLRSMELSADAPSRAVAEAASHYDPAVRVAAAYHPNLDFKIREVMVDDPDSEVAAAARNALMTDLDVLATSYVFGLALRRPAPDRH